MIRIVEFPPFFYCLFEPFQSGAELWMASMIRLLYLELAHQNTTFIPTFSNPSHFKSPVVKPENSPTPKLEWIVAPP